MSQEPRVKMGQDRLAEGKENKTAAAAEPLKKRKVPSGVLWFTVGNSMQAGNTTLPPQARFSARQRKTVGEGVT